MRQPTFPTFSTLVALVLVSVVAIPPSPARADLAAGDLAPGATWYLHADFEGMRTSAAGGELYAWFNREAADEIRDELGIDVGEEVDRLTAFSDNPRGLMLVAEGPLSETFRNVVLDRLKEETLLERFEHAGEDYYRVTEQGHDADDDDAAFFSFAVGGKLLVASDEKRLREMIDNKGHIASGQAQENTLLVLTADKQFVQAGMRTAQFADDEDSWDSNILRNTEQIALLISDQDGLVAVEAQLLSRDSQMTRSIGNIVNGLISLQAFNSEMNPAVAGALENTRVTIADKVLSISTVLRPDDILDLIDD